MYFVYVNIRTKIKKENSEPTDENSELDESECGRSEKTITTATTVR